MPSDAAGHLSVSPMRHSQASASATRRARQGLIQNFTGIHSAYDEPESPEIKNTADMSAEEAAERVVGFLNDAGHLSGEAGLKQ